MTNDVDDLLKNKPENFDEVKEWANFQLAVKQASKKESFLREMAGLATTLTAIIGVATAAFTAVQLWNKIKQDDADQATKYQFEALKLYTEHWDDFNKAENCPRFTVFASTIKDKYALLAKSVSNDYERVCRSQIGNPAATANVNVEHPTQNTSYYTLEQVTPTASAQTISAPSFSGQTIYIQYQQDNDAAKQLARSLQAYVVSDKIGSKSPGIEGVADVPARDEIRIYKSAQQELAQLLGKKLESEFGRTFVILNLEKSYPKLPANSLEIWLKK
jgi:hypothetical protein